METTTLQCWVYRDDTETIFLVEILKDKTVVFLKKIIREKTPEFRNVDARHLQLSRGDHEHLKDKLERLSLKTRTHHAFVIHEPKYPTFPYDDSEREWLIVVDVPNSGAPISMYSIALLTTYICSQVQARLRPLSSASQT